MGFNNSVFGNSGHFSGFVNSGDTPLSTTVADIHSTQHPAPNIIVRDAHGNIIGTFRPDEKKEAEAAMKRNPGSQITR